MREVASGGAAAPRRLGCVRDRWCWWSAPRRHRSRGLVRMIFAVPHGHPGRVEMGVEDLAPDGAEGQRGPARPAREGRRQCPFGEEPGVQAFERMRVDRTAHGAAQEHERIQRDTTVRPFVPSRIGSRTRICSRVATESLPLGLNSGCAHAWTIDSRRSISTSSYTLSRTAAMRSCWAGVMFHAST